MYQGYVKSTLYISICFVYKYLFRVSRCIERCDNCVLTTRNIVILVCITFLILVLSCTTVLIVYMYIIKTMVMTTMTNDDDDNEDNNDNNNNNNNNIVAARIHTNARCFSNIRRFPQFSFASSMAARAGDYARVARYASALVRSFVDSNRIAEFSQDIEFSKIPRDIR